jgi:hypothetical protein
MYSNGFKTDTVRLKPDTTRGSGTETVRLKPDAREGFATGSGLNPRMLAASVAVAIVLMAAPLARPAAAQERPGPVAELAAGALLFPDDGGIITEGVVGGAARFYVLPRVSLGPEIAYIQGDNHNHLMLTANVTFDFLRPANGEPRAVTPFVVVGGGLFRSRDSFRNEVFTSTEGAFTAGGGVRALVGKRVIVGLEARIGWELHIRLNGILGVRLGR